MYVKLTVKSIACILVALGPNGTLGSTRTVRCETNITILTLYNVCEYGYVKTGWIYTVCPR